ncbi:hypothetical protein [Streptomyces sp. NL15-2K]|uniref:hypothetical protein n=1 Tax=Streptomyces sp. NL15-2K TaxID=376149 RepID=UPI001C0EE1D1|nr:hypothetical protein [Streptomyces sp. NL15-2K]
MTASHLLTMSSSSRAQQRNPAGHQDVVIGEERVEDDASADMCRPLRIRQVCVRLDHPGAARLSQDPSGLVTTMGTAAEVPCQAPQLFAVALFVYDGDEADVSQAALVAGLGGVVRKLGLATRHRRAWS